MKITCLAYSSRGDFLAVGFDTGHVEVLDSITLQVEGKTIIAEEGDVNEDHRAKFDYANDGIKYMAFSHDTNYLACAVSFKFLLYNINDSVFLDKFYFAKSLGV